MSIDSLISTFGVQMQVYTRVESKDAGGALVKTYTASATYLTVFMQPSGPNEALVNGAIRMTTSFTAYINAVDGASVTTGIRFVDANSIMYEITGFKKPDLRSSPDPLSYYIVSVVTVEGQT